MAKVPLLLLPGLLCDKDVWSYQQVHLSHMVDIIIPDLNHAMTPNEMVESVLNNAPQNFILAGHSMGGWVALEVMKQHSHRVLGLALLNTTALPDSQEKREARNTMIMQAEQGNAAVIIDKLISLFVYQKAVTRKVRPMFARNISAFINQENAMLQREECMTILKLISCPTLIIHATEDAVFHFEDSEILRSNINNATLAVIKNCGHMSPMESPQEVTRLMTLWLHKIQNKNQ